jgi:enamine deaminase RidA (YjgF/YER057c/UK114 family)
MNFIPQNLSALGITLPKSSGAAANYVPFKQEGNLLFISGQTCRENGEMIFSGKVSDVEYGQQAAKQCGLNIFAQLQEFCGGDWDKIVSCSRLTVFVNCESDFTLQAKVADGVSDLIVSVMGEAGRHTRSAVGVSSLPSDSSVEVDAIFVVRE